MLVKFKYSILFLFIITAKYGYSIENAPGIEENKNQNYEFDEALLKGSGIPVDEIKGYIENNNIKPGSYNIDVNLNNIYLFHGDVLVRDKGTVCLTQKQIEKIPSEIIRKQLAKKAAYPCLLINDFIPEATTSIDLSRMVISISIPDSELEKQPQGFVPPEVLEPGETMFVSNYNLNQYYSRFKNGVSKEYRSTWLGLNNAINLGLWQFRQQGSWISGQPGDTSWHNNRVYVQRAIIPLRSNLTLGENYTGGTFFSGMAYKGISINSDERMLPDSQRGYAPVVRGIAQSNAKVTIRQGNTIIRETTVAPGSFVINDLLPTVYSGDLEVTVTEADGSKSVYSVPFSAAPESVRPGEVKYSATLGQSRYVGDDALFSEINVNYGISNNVTLNMANRLAQGYQAGRAGGVYSNRLGAFGLGAAFSHAELPDHDYSGWMFNLTYSKRFNPTDTTVSIAGYRYSTSDYRELSDVLSLRQAYRNNNNAYITDTLNQASRFEVTLDQTLGEIGNVWISGSTQQYHDNRKKDIQYQLGYSKQFENGVTFNASVARSRYSDQTYRNSGYDGYAEDGYTARRQTLTTLSLSIPFGADRSKTLSTTYNHQNGQDSTIQTSLSGVTGTTRPVNYGLSYARGSGSVNTVSATAQTSTSFGSIQGSLSQSENYLQGSAGLQGAIVVHRGGITTGPYVGETFALIEAKGAKGAKVVGVQAAQVDRFGYALSPAITPYKYNTIAPDSSGLNSNAEIKNSSQRIAPYAGAMLKVKFSVSQGFPMLIDVLTKQVIPMGANIYNSEGNLVGMLGQGNQAWVRNEKVSDSLKIAWGKNKSCVLQYNISAPQKEEALIRLKEKCQ